jgi:hypothetical protein
VTTPGGAASLRIAFDMDGVLADMHASLAVEAERMFTEEEASTVHALETAIERETPVPPRVPRLAAPPPLTLTAQQSDKLWERVAGTENFWEGLAETELGIVGRLARLASEQRWEVIFLTQRPPTRGATVQQQTQAWLRRHGYDMPSVYTTRGSRGAIAAALNLDMVVDDRLEGCVAVADESNARAVLVWRESDERVAAKARRIGITIVRSVGECLDLLERVESPGTSEPGLMDRLKAAFRLKRR